MEQIRFVMLVLLASVVVVGAEEIYLKNGGLVKGTIIEFTPGETYKIQTSDGSIFVYSIDEVKTIKYGPTVLPSTAPPREIIIGNKKAPAVGVLAAWLLPTVGHAYAGDWGRGGKYLLGEIGSIVLLATGASQTEVNYDGYFFEEQLTDNGALLVILGAGGLIVFRVAEFIDAYKAVQDYNKKVQPSFSFNIQKVGNTATFGMRYHF